MQKKVLVLGSVAALVLAAGAGAWFVFRPSLPTSISTSSSSLGLSIETHTDDERGFAFDYPQNWQYIGDEDLGQRNEDFVVGVMARNLPGTACGMMVDERTEELEYDPQELTAELDQLLGQKLQDFRRLEARGLEVKGLPAIFYSYNYTREGTTTDVRFQQYLIFALDRVYTFSCGCPETRFEEFEKDFDLILGSFRLLK